MELSLDVEIRTLLETRKGEWQAIARQAKVSHSWLSKFVNGHIPNPGYGTLKRLKAHLVGIATAPDRRQPDHPSPCQGEDIDRRAAAQEPSGA
jgi:hypothetical protein